MRMIYHLSENIIGKMSYFSAPENKHRGYSRRFEAEKMKE